jgi:hypothetical protein
VNTDSAYRKSSMDEAEFEVIVAETLDAWVDIWLGLNMIVILGSVRLQNGAGRLPELDKLGLDRSVDLTC